MTNKEWLDYLAHNAPDELAAWFDAEHEESAQLKDMFGILGNLPTDPGEAAIAAVEGFVRERSNDTFRGENDAKAGSECPNDENGTLDGDTAAQDGDSRDKLEADVRKIAEAYNMDTQRHGTERFAHELYYSIIHLLDRQAVLTEDCWRYKVDALIVKGDQLANANAELKAEVDELTAERDKLQEQLRIGWECECRLQAERERYREKFGKCIDYADAIHALMDDEGMA